jgi:branched-chain amino acid transport system substrate-binding protein
MAPASVASAIIPAGADRAIGTMTSVYLKDPSDPAWNDDPGIKQYKAFMAKWMPEGNPNESLNAFGYMVVIIMHKVLEQCGGNFTRANIMAQVNNLKNVESPVLLPWRQGQHQPDRPLSAHAAAAAAVGRQGLPALRRDH